MQKYCPSVNPIQFQKLSKNYSHHMSKVMGATKVELTLLKTTHDLKIAQHYTFTPLYYKNVSAIVTYYTPELADDDGAAGLVITTLGNECLLARYKHLQAKTVSAEMGHVWKFLPAEGGGSIAQLYVKTEINTKDAAPEFFKEVADR
jgi:hypothetical protein